MPKRILFLSHGSNLDGGAEKNLLYILAHLDRQRYEPLVCLPREGPLAVKLRELEIKYYLLDQFWMVFANASWPVLTVNLFLNIGPTRRLVKLIEREQVDAVYSNSAVIFCGGVAARLVGIPHLWHIREFVFANPEMQFGFGRRRFAAVLATLADKILVVSKAAAEIFRFRCAEKIQILHDPLDHTQWGPPPDPQRVEKLRQELRLPPGSKVLIFLGTLSPNKAPHEAVEALGLSGRKDTYLLLVGRETRPEKRCIFQAINRFALEKQVLFTGYREDVKNLLGLADLYIAPSGVEAWGNATVQALACGVPAIVANQGGAAEIVQDGVTGFKVDPHAPEQIAKKINYLLENPSLARAMGQEGRRRVLAEYNPTYFFQDLYAALDTVLQSQTRAYTLRELFTAVWR